MPVDSNNRCEALVVETAWKKAHPDSLQCDRVARVLIRRKRLCNRHAEMEALCVCLELGAASRVLVAPPARVMYEGVPVVKKTSPT